MSNMDEFSFPTIPVEQEPLCQLPFPLWFVSSIADQETDHHHRRSFSSPEEAAKMADALELASSALSLDDKDQFLNDEERMDMLWEDFNEELRRMSCDRKMDAANGEASSNSSSTDSRRHGMVDLPCIQAFGASTSSSIIHHRRPSWLLMLKVLKKLFLIQKTGSSKRKSLQ
ncbi:uncharacterized protein [Elaeis guineensis]|uniref:Uncharacterized protein LOC105038472 n=1 Tax=Elaeis guineensis var. tenera TaxID=51953 RepID=A0A6I9QSE9_ELAGV|nr:uncharacterized protein LOC105038472 [Elaeis guineensis]